MAAASPSRATAQPGCLASPPVHPFLPDVLMEARRPPAKGGVALLWLPCLQNAGVAPQPRQPRVPGLSLAALAVSLALQARDPLPSPGVTPGFTSLLHIPEGRRWRHPWLPAPPASLCQLWLVWLRKIPGFWQWGSHGKATPALPETTQQEQGEPLPTPLMPAHPNPGGVQSGGFTLTLISQGDTQGKGLWIILCFAPSLGQCEPVDVSRQPQPWVRGASVQPLAPLTPKAAAAG